uniref:Uncharacterized protein n=1 Tax=Meloidogyne enterolobii TaxID=390850 RepID=A0A6V7V5B6_MELEN|nr:unnamed protein product [Meloidogyne enterolobii]
MNRGVLRVFFKFYPLFSLINVPLIFSFSFLFYYFHVMLLIKNLSFLYHFLFPFKLTALTNDPITC